MDSCFKAFHLDTSRNDFTETICSLCTWNDHVIAGLEDGRVLLASSQLLQGAPSTSSQHELPTARQFDTSQARPLQQQDDSSLLLQEESSCCVADGATWQVVQASKGLSKKPISQMRVVKKRPLLLVLTDEGVNLYSLPELLLQCQANRSRGASLFAWDEERSMLAVAVKRRITLFNLHGSDLLELKDFNANDQVNSLLCDGEHLILCTKKECSCINMTTGSASEVFSSSKPFTSSIAALPGGEVMVTRDNLGIFLTAEGKPSRHAPLTWSAAPLSVAISPPYAVAALPDGLEVRSISKLSNHTVFQTIPLPNMLAFSPVLTDDGQLFVASGGTDGIKRLSRTPWSSQCWALAEQGEFSVAMEILHLIPDSELERRQLLEDMLRVLQGFELFSDGEFDKGMAQISLSSSPHPLILLCLYPSLVPSKYLHLLPTQILGRDLPPVNEPAAAAYPRAVSLLLPYLLSLRTRLMAKPSSASRAGNGTTCHSPTPARAANGSSMEAAAGAQAAAEEGPSREETLSVLDTVILKAQLLMPDTGALLHFVQQENWVDLQEAEKALTDTGRYAELVALYQQHGRHAAGLDMLSKLSQDESALSVKPTGAAADLPGLPGVWAGLRYLMGIGHSPDAASLAKAHARWVLQQDPEAALEAYLQMKPALDVDTAWCIVSTYAPEYRLVYLEAAVELGIARPEKYHTELLLMYLQVALDEDKINLNVPSGDMQPSLSTYVKSKARQPVVLFPHIAPNASVGNAPSCVLHNGFAGQQHTGHAATRLDTARRYQPQNVYQKLRELVRKSRYIAPAYVHSQLPPRRLPEIRALLYERLGSYRQALHLYCHSIKDMGLAEAYCDRVYDALMAKKRGAKKGGSTTPSEGSYLELLDRPSDIYMELIMVLLRGESTDEKMESCPAPLSLPETLNLQLWRQVPGVISRKSDRVKPSQMLKLIRNDPLLEEVFPFLEHILTQGTSNLPHLPHPAASQQFPPPDPTPSASATSHINSLPQSLLHEIFRQEMLGPKELCAVSATCQYWNKLNQDAAANKVWKEFFSLKWMVSTHDMDVSWQHMYGLKMRRIASRTGKYMQDNFYGHSAGVRCLKLLPSHGLMATGSLDRTVRLWSLTSGLPISVSKLQPGTVRAIAMDGESLISGGMDNFIRIWHANHTRPNLLYDLTSRPSLLQGHIGPVSSLSMTENLLFSGSWDYSVRIWSRSDWRCAQVLKFSDWVWCLAARGNNLLVSTGPEVIVHDLGSGKVVRKFQHLHDGHVSCLEGTQNSKLMFSGSADGLVMQHDLRMKDPSSVLWHHTSGVNGLAFEDPWLTSCSSDGTAMLLNYECPTRQAGNLRLTPTCRQLAGPGGPVYCVDIADQWLACGADSEVVRTWDFTKAAVSEQRVDDARAMRRSRRKSGRKHRERKEAPLMLGDAASGSAASAAPTQSSASGSFPSRQVHSSLRHGKQPAPHAPPRAAPGQVWQVARPRTPHQPAAPPADKRLPNRVKDS